MKKIILSLILISLILILPLVSSLPYPYPLGDGTSVAIVVIGNDQEQENYLIEDSGINSIAEEKQVDDGGLPDDQAKCKRAKGCFDEIGCHPVGYVKNGTYCADTGKTATPGETSMYSWGTFLNQSETGASCNNNYECITNICLHGICIDREEEINKQVDVKVEEIKSDIVNKVDEGLEQLENMENLSINTEYGEVEVDKNLIKQVLNWIKDIFI